MVNSAAFHFILGPIFSAAQTPRLYSELHEALAQEYGLPVLADGTYPGDRVRAFLAEADIDYVLDAIEVEPSRQPPKGLPLSPGSSLT